MGTITRRLRQEEPDIQPDDDIVPFIVRADQAFDEEWYCQLHDEYRHYRKLSPLVAHFVANLKAGVLL